MSTLSNENYAILTHFWLIMFDRSLTPYVGNYKDAQIAEIMVILEFRIRSGWFGSLRDESGRIDLDREVAYPEH